MMNPPAFPSAPSEKPLYFVNGVPYHGGSPGMTLRDWYAGCELSKIAGAHLLDERIAYERLAEHCYRMADAMLKARAV